MDQYHSRVVKGAGTIFVLMAASSLLAYFLRLVLAKKLTQEQFGLFFAVYSIVLLIGWIKNFGLPSTIQKFIPGFAINQEHHKIKSLLVFVLSAVLLTGIAVFFLALVFPSSLLEIYFKSSLAKSLLLILIIYIIIDSLSQIIVGYFISTSRYFLYSLKDFVLRLIVLLLALFLPLSVFTVGWLYVVAALSVLLMNLFFFFRSFRFFSHPFSLTREMMNNVLRFSAPLVIRDFVGILMSYVDTIALVFFRPLTEVAIYHVILPTADLLLLFGRPFGRIMFPISAELWALQQKEKIASLLQQIHKNLFLFLIPLYFGIFFFAGFILTTLFGVKYSSGVLGLQILAFGFIFSSINISCNDVMLGIGKTKTSTSIILGCNLINVILNLILIPFFGRINEGYLGAIIATVVASFLSFVLLLYYLRKYLTYSPPLKAWFTGIVIGLIILEVGKLLAQLFTNVYLQIVIMVSLFILFYIPLLIVFGITSREELSSLYHLLFQKKSV